MFGFVNNNTSFKLFGFLLISRMIVMYCFNWLHADFVWNSVEPHVSTFDETRYM